MMTSEAQSRTKNVRVMRMLNLAYSRETSYWRPCAFHCSRSVKKGVEVSGEQRDAVVKWLLKLNDGLRFSPETIFTAVSLVDRFLHVVKAHPKYLNCLALSCFYIAIKITEDSEVVPTVRQILEISQCVCSSSELRRMEWVIVKKLDWCLKPVTSLDFIHIFHALLSANSPALLGVDHEDSTNLMLSLGVKLKLSLPYYELGVFAPSTVALAMVSLELELCCKKWLSLTVYLQNLSENNHSDFLLCRRELSRIASTFSGPVSSSGVSKPSLLFISVKHDVKKEHTDVDDIYDSIKHLYCEDEIMSCSAAAAQNGLSQVKDSQPTSIAAI